MKLIIQVPCYNEAETLPITLAGLPRKVEGFDKVEWLIINDGSTDSTLEAAKKLGVDHIVSFKKNLGLAKAFYAGINACIKYGADVIVNTDADNQYDSKCIPTLIAPILSGKADIVIGARPIGDIEHFSQIKKLLQKLGSWAVRLISSTDVADAPSGFRAITKEAAAQLNVFSDYTYTIETIIQAGRKGFVVCSVPISVNKQIRHSRLIKNIFSYINKSMGTMIRVFVLYKPFKSFFIAGALLFTAGLALGARFLVYYILGDGNGHIQSLILTSVLLIMGVQTILMAFLADIVSVNRVLLEDIKNKLKNEHK